MSVLLSSLILLLRWLTRDMVNFLSKGDVHEYFVGWLRCILWWWIPKALVKLIIIITLLILVDCHQLSLHSVRVLLLMYEEKSYSQLSLVAGTWWSVVAVPHLQMTICSYRKPSLESPTSSYVDRLPHDPLPKTVTDYKAVLSRFQASRPSRASNKRGIILTLTKPQ